MFCSRKFKKQRKGMMANQNAEHLSVKPYQDDVSHNIKRDTLLIGEIFEL